MLHTDQSSALAPSSAHRANSRQKDQHRMGAAAALEKITSNMSSRQVSRRGGSVDMESAMSQEDEA